MSIRRYLLCVALLPGFLFSQSWVRIFESNSTTSFFQDPIDSNRVIFFSQGVAGSWEIIELESSNVVRQEPLTIPLGHLAINPLNSDHWLMSWGHTIRRSDDRGTTWNVIEDTLLYEMEWMRTWIPALDTSSYYAGSGGPYPGSLYRYKGESWEGYGGIEPTWFVERPDNPTQFLYSGIYWSGSQIYLMDMITDERTELLTGSVYDSWWTGGDIFHVYRFWPIPDAEAERYLVSARMDWYDHPDAGLGFSVLTLDGSDVPSWSAPEFVDYLPYNYSMPEFKEGQLFIPVRPEQNSEYGAGVAFSGDLGQTWGLLDTTGLPQNSGSGNHIIHTVIEGSEYIYFSAPGGVYRADFPMDIIQDYAALEPRSQRPSTFSLGDPFPNPFNAGIHIPFTLNRSGEGIKLRIMDITGRTVREVTFSNLDPGDHEWRWRGLSTQGIELPSGVYLVHISGRAEQRSAKIVLLR